MLIVFEFISGDPAAAVACLPKGENVSSSTAGPKSAPRRRGRPRDSSFRTVSEYAAGMRNAEKSTGTVDSARPEFFVARARPRVETTRFLRF